jgi:hypothetical protein
MARIADREEAIPVIWKTWKAERVGFQALHSDLELAK